MTSIILEPTATAQWQALIAEAEKSCQQKLSEDNESYLVFLLMRFLSRPDMASNVMAFNYLNSQLATGTKRVEGLRDVGDQCLLISGLFPKRANKRRVKLSYFVDMGRSAYSQIAENVSHGMGVFYRQLSADFVSMMDVLQAVRDLGQAPSHLNAVESFDLWCETGSRKALQELRQFTDGTLVNCVSTKIN